MIIRVYKKDGTPVGKMEAQPGMRVRHDRSWRIVRVNKTTITVFYENLKDKPNSWIKMERKHPSECTLYLEEARKWGFVLRRAGHEFNKRNQGLKVVDPDEVK